MFLQSYVFPVVKLVLIAISFLLIAPFAFGATWFDRHGKLSYRFSTIWFQTILTICCVNLKVQGTEHLKVKGPYIFVANHRSNYDIPALSVALRPFQVRWAAKKELLKIPVFGWILRAGKHVIIDRGNTRHAIHGLSMAKEQIRAGISILFFPEGTRSINGRMLPFKRGGFRLAVETGTPVVPVTINGSSRILGKSQWRIRRGEIGIVVSPPIPVNGYPKTEVGLLSQQARGCIEQNYQS